MKTLEELVKIRERALLKSQGISANEAEQSIRYTLTIGLATCGIIAGARPVFTTLLECITENQSEDVKILQTGCFGHCSEEPMLKLEDEFGQVFYYGHLDAKRAKQIYEEHIKLGKPITQYYVEMES
jgi:NADP-reducing hydrogenase subunit HndB